MTVVSPEDTIYLTSETGFYKNETFKSEVVKTTKNSFLIKTLYDHGKVVLLPVGMLVKVDVQNGSSFYSEIIEKNPKGHRGCLELLLPYQRIKKKEYRAPKIITVTSGKGGVGKTTILLNLAAALSQMGLKICVVDADLGTANVDVLLNLNAHHTLKDIADGKLSIYDVLLEGPNNCVVIPGTSGFQAMTSITEAQVQRIVNRLGLLGRYIDLILVDTCPGVSNNTMFFNQFADQAILITSTEPHAITDAYAALKVMVDRLILPELFLIVNKAEDESEAREISGRITNAAKKFLSLNVIDLGYVFDDPYVVKSVKRLTPCVLKYPESMASDCYNKIAHNIYTTHRKTINNLPLFEKLKQKMS
ncbi:MAG: MinD/ParA family protein [Clostridia bacterium]|nr:MinD/ParA family protein [Clostridia bacterium]